ncbi:MAG TPA: hypothetical protein VNF50_00025 [Acidimicrobiales bacterium]|nr:hypothetical protein [Acidimicrobiales bacterium]
MSEPTRPELTLSEAAAACRVDRRTIRRRLDAEEFPNAHRTAGRTGPDDGPWVIPVADLIGAGLSPNVSKVDHQAAEVAPDTIASLQAELADWRRRAEVAEAVASERAATNEALRLALVALGTGRTGSTPDAQAGPYTSAPAVRRRWWRR